MLFFVPFHLVYLLQSPHVFHSIVCSSYLLVMFHAFSCVLYLLLVFLFYYYRLRLFFNFVFVVCMLSSLCLHRPLLPWFEYLTVVQSISSVLLSIGYLKYCYDN